MVGLVFPPHPPLLCIVLAQMMLRPKHTEPIPDTGRLEDSSPPLGSVFPVYASFPICFETSPCPVLYISSTRLYHEMVPTSVPLCCSCRYNIHGSSSLTPLWWLLHDVGGDLREKSKIVLRAGIEPATSRLRYPITVSRSSN